VEELARGRALSESAKQTSPNVIGKRVGGVSVLVSGLCVPCGLGGPVGSVGFPVRFCFPAVSRFVAGPSFAVLFFPFFEFHGDVKGRTVVDCEGR